MAPRRRNEAVLIAVLTAATVLSFLAAYSDWEGSMDTRFWTWIVLGTACMLLAIASLALFERTILMERHLRVPLVSVTRGPFTKEPPIRGKGPV